jgi:glutamyl-tRNA reductase
MSVIVIGISHRTAPVTVRENFAFSEASIPGALTHLKQTGLVREAVILSTCNRVEIYAATDSDNEQAFEALRHFLVREHAQTEPVDDAVYTLGEPQSLQHLFRVACGLDSMVLGETEVLGQLKHAYDLALRHKHTGSRLNKAFQKAFNVAKQIRTETGIQKGCVSVASVAVELAEKVFNSLEHRTVMVIGAGDTSEKTARALLSRGAANLLVTNRTLENAQALVNELGGRAVAFDHWESEFGRVDIIVSSTSAGRYILDRPKLEPLMRQRKNHPLLLVDIAVPRDIDPDVNYLDNVYLYNIDDLQSIANDYLKQRQAQIAGCERIINEKVQGLLNHPSAHFHSAGGDLSMEHS